MALVVNPKRERRRRFAVPLGDGRSRLAMFRDKIERQLTKEYRPKSAMDRLRISNASAFLAMVEQVKVNIGRDPKATPRRMVSLVMAAERVLDKLDHTPKPLTPEQERKRFERDMRKQNKAAS